MAKNKTTKTTKTNYGTGTFYLTSSGTWEYKKFLRLKDGSKDRRTVHGKTKTECYEKMDALQEKLNKELPIEPDKQTLIDALLVWIGKKKPTVKEQAYIRELGTIKNQIGTSKIASYPYQTITAEEIQDVLNMLNEQGYSYSVLKKTYDTLSAFFREMSLREKFENPMLYVPPWRKINVNKAEKKIEFFGDQDMEKFEKQANERYSTGKLKYPTGNALAANMYLGLRVGELLALQWRDVDLENSVIVVCKTLIEINNPEYNPEYPEKMKRLGIKKIIFKIQETTKTGKIRRVPVPDKAEKLLKMHYDSAQYHDPDDYVICTRNRKTSTTKNVSDTIKSIVQRGSLETQAWNTHILRHTCASLYCRSGVSLSVIAEILGNSVEVLQSRYIHTCDNQLQDAAKQLDNALRTE